MHQLCNTDALVSPVASIQPDVKVTDELHQNHLIWDVRKGKHLHKHEVSCVCKVIPPGRLQASVSSSERSLVYKQWVQVVFLYLLGSLRVNGFD